MSADVVRLQVSELPARNCRTTGVEGAPPGGRKMAEIGFQVLREYTALKQSTDIWVFYSDPLNHPLDQLCGT